MSALPAFAEGPHRLALQISDNDADKMNAVLNVAANVSKYYSDKGEEVDFKNTIIVLTANVGSDTIMKVCADPDTRPDAAGLASALRPDLLKAFKPGLLFFRSARRTTPLLEVSFIRRRAIN